MVDGAARPKKTFGRKIKSHDEDISTLFGLIGDGHGGSIVSGSPRGNAIGSGSPGIPEGKFLPLEGGTMEGTIGHLPEALQISGGNLKLSENSASVQIKIRKNIFVSPETPTTDDLDTIEGRVRPGQEHRLIGISGNTITIKHNNTGAESGNKVAILCPGATDYTLASTDSVDLFYDDVNLKWRIVGDLSTTTGGSKHVIQDEGIALTARTNLNFIGGAVTVTDNAGTNSSDVTITGAGSNLWSDIVINVPTKDMLASSLVNLGGITTTFSHGIIPTATALTIDYAVSTDLKIDNAGTNVVSLDSSLKNFAITDYTLQLIESISGEAGSIAKTASQMLYNSTDKHTFDIAVVPVLDISATEIDAFQNIDLNSQKVVKFAGLDSDASILPSIGKIKLGNNELLGWIKTDNISTVNFGLGSNDILSVLGADLGLNTNKIIGIGGIDSDATILPSIGKIKLGNNELLGWLKTDLVNTVNFGLGSDDNLNVLNANLGLNANKIIGLANGVDPNDAVNKSQLDAVSGGFTEPIRQTENKPTLQTQPTTTNLDIDSYNIFTLDGLNKDITLAFTGTGPSTLQYQLMHIIIIHDNTSNTYNITWPSSVSGTPTINQTANGITDVVLYSIDGSSTWYFVVHSGNVIGGGGSGLQNIVEDLTPELGSNLDALGNIITNLGSLQFSRTATGINTASGIELATGVLDSVQIQFGGIPNYTFTDTAMNLIGNDLLQTGFIQLKELFTLPAGASGLVPLYAKDDGGVQKLFYKNSNDVEIGPLGEGTNSPLTTKGDLFGRTVSGDDRIPAGVDGEVLVADSTNALGVSWQAGAGGGANTQLSNLISPVQVNQHMSPNDDITLDLGVNSTNRWRDLWLGRNASILGTMIVGGAVTMLATMSVSGTTNLDGNSNLGSSSSDTIFFRGKSGTHLDMDEFDIEKISTASFYDGLGNLVGEIRGNNASPDVMEIRLGSSSDFLITDNGITRLDFDNTLQTWSFQGASVMKLPQETQISDRSFAPSTPPSGQMSFYCINSGGNQSFRVKFDNGVEKTIATDV